MVIPWREGVPQPGNGATPDRDSLFQRDARLGLCQVLSQMQAEPLREEYTALGQGFEGAATVTHRADVVAGKAIN